MRPSAAASRSRVATRSRSASEARTGARSGRPDSVSMGRLSLRSPCLAYSWTWHASSSAGLAAFTRCGTGRRLAEGVSTAGGTGRPPDPIAHQLDEGRDHDRAHHERVEQDSEGDHEADVEDERLADRHQHREGSSEDEAGTRDDRAGRAEREQDAFARAVPAGLLTDAAHQEDRVVDS